MQSPGFSQMGVFFLGLFIKSDYDEISIFLLIRMIKADQVGEKPKSHYYSRDRRDVTALATQVN